MKTPLFSEPKHLYQELSSRARGRGQCSRYTTSLPWNN